MNYSYQLFMNFHTSGIKESKTMLALNIIVISFSHSSPSLLFQMFQQMFNDENVIKEHLTKMALKTRLAAGFNIFNLLIFTSRTIAFQFKRCIEIFINIYYIRSF